jgi:hypothetical protein
MGLREKFLASGKELARVGLTVKFGNDTHEVYASDLTGRQRIEFEKFMHGQLDDQGRLTSSTAIAAKLVQLGLVDEDGAAIFKGDDHKEICDSISSQLIEYLAREIGIVAGIYSAQPQGEQEEDEDQTLDADANEDPHTAGLSPKNAGGEQGNCL